MTYSLDTRGFEVPVVRELSTFVLLFFLPGCSVLRIMRLHLDAVKTGLLSLAISMLLTMVTGTILNISGGHFGIGIPLTAINLLIINSIVTALLAIMYFFLESGDYAERPFKLPSLTTLEIVLIAMPFAAIISARYADSTGFGTLQIALYLAVAAMVAYMGLSKNIDPRTYPIAIVCLGLTLLLQTTLVSRYMVEWADVSFEFWSARNVVQSGYWDPSIFGRTNSVLSITILLPTYSLVSGMDLVTTFKLVPPLLFCAVPLAVFEISKRFSGERPALAAAFLLIGSTCYYTEMLGLNRQMIAEVFLACFILMLLMVEIDGRHKWMFLLLFSLGMTLSHYGLIMILVSCLIMTGIIFIPLKMVIPGNLIPKRRIFGAAIFFVAALYIWYSFIITPEMFDLMLNITNTVLDGLGELQSSGDSIVFDIFRLDQLNALDIFLVVGFYFTLASMVLGITRYALNIKRTGQGRIEYLALSISFVLAILAGVYSPNVFNAVSESRLHHIALVVLAPMVPLGLNALLHKLHKPVYRWEPKKACNVLMTLFVVASFLLYSGVMTSMVAEPTSYQLSPDEVERVHFSDGEYLSVMWGQGTVKENTAMYGDAYEAYLTELYFGEYGPLFRTDDRFSSKFSEYYFFLGHLNLEGYVWLEDPDNPRLNISLEVISPELRSTFYENNLVYCSQGARVFYH